MKTLRSEGKTTIGDTEFSFGADVQIEEETWEVPGSEDVKITEVIFNGEFNPYEIKATEEFAIKPGQSIADFIAANLHLFKCNDESIYGNIHVDAIEKIDNM